MDNRCEIDCKDMETKTKTFFSILSSYGLSIANNILSIGFSLVLLRLLEPTHFGLFATAFAIFGMLAMVIPIGQNTLFVRKGNYPLSHLIQVIAINAIIVIVLIEAGSSVFFVIHEDLPRIMRLLVLGLFPASVNLAFMSLVLRRLNHYKLFPAWILETISYGVLAILFAINNYGIYSLVLGILISKFLFLIAAIVIFRKDMVSFTPLSIKPPSSILLDSAHSLQ